MQRLISAYATFLGLPFGPELVSMVSSPSDLHESKVNEAIAFIEAQRQRFHYPGLALAVVQGNQVRSSSIVPLSLILDVTDRR